MPKDKTTGGTALGGGAAIVHEDDELIVVDKPAGMISGKPDDTSGKTLFHLVKAHAGERARRGRREGEQRAWIIHRLDRDVSGLLVFAKTHTAYLALKDQLQRRQVRRRYLAMVRGEMPTTPPGQWQWIDAFLADAGAGRPTRLARPGKMDVRRPTRRPGKPGRPVRAVTYYRVLTAGHRRSLLVVRLDTGRRHQIRAHLAGQGHPVIGDRLYGKGRESIGKLALHAWELSFAHPATGQVMRFVSPPPADFLVQTGASPDVLAREAAAAPTGQPDAEAPPTEPPIAGPGDKAARGKPAGPARTAGPAARTAGPSGGKTARARRQAGWDHVAGGYEDLVAHCHSDYHDDLVVPGVLRLLAPRARQRVLDVACEEGLLCRRLAELGVRTVGVDASERLIHAARGLARRLPADTRPRFLVGDARRLTELPELAELPGRPGRPGRFDAAVSVLALMNIDPVEPVLRGVAGLLRPGGVFVAVMMHPAFRAPGQTSWGYERPMHQYRRVDAYLSPAHRSIVMNPGQVARGKPAVTTITWHRPIQTYVNALAAAGLLIDALEEWPSHRASQPGPHAGEHDRACREIPMFLALRGRKV